MKSSKPNAYYKVAVSSIAMNLSPKEVFFEFLLGNDIRRERVGDEIVFYQDQSLIGAGWVEIARMRIEDFEWA